MSLSAYLPPVPRPPHDPRTWVLNPHAGWRTAAATDVVENESGQLALARLDPGAAIADRFLPANLALGYGDTWLLDQERGLLLHFDRCECRFEVVPCIGGNGQAPRRFDAPRTLAFADGLLYVCDSGNRRIQVFDVHGWTLRRIITSPALLRQAGLPDPWLPVELVSDRARRLWIHDRANGVILVLGCRPGRDALFRPAAPVTRLLPGPDGTVYAWLENQELHRLDLEPGGEIAATLAEGAWPEFNDSPISHRSGYIELGAGCAGAPAEQWFDGAGRPVAAASVPAVPPLRYASSGQWISSALDSVHNHCQWDRVELQCRLPKGTRLRVHAYTSELEQDDAEILLLDAAEWSHCMTLNSGSPVAAGNADGMLRAAPGRFLWLKIEFEGDASASPLISAIHLDYPRISLRRYLPAVFGAEPLAADFSDRLLAILDRGFRGVEQQIDWQAGLFDADSAPHEKQRDFLGWLASWIGVTFFQGWSEKQKREFLKQAARLFAKRGTLEGLVQQLLWSLGIAQLQPQPRKGGCAACSDAEPPHWRHPQVVLEHFRLRRWMFLGRGRLSEQANLWGEQLLAKSRLGSHAINGVTRLDNVKDALRDPFHIHAHQFSVFLPACSARAAAAGRALRDLVEREKPAHTRANIVFVRPRFRIGIQSMIGFDSVIGRWPAGVRLQDMNLGKATVLTSATNPQSGLRIAGESRVGQTTVMK